jgi:hypothetical protein
MPSFHHMALSLNVSLILYSERCLLLNYAIVLQTGGPWNTFGARFASKYPPDDFQ